DLYDQLKNVLQKFILKLNGKGIVVIEEALIMFHLEFYDEEANLLKAEFIQVGSQIETAEQNLIRDIALLEKEIENTEEEINKLIEASFVDFKR
nr:hypothetical protein [Tanacetum cinerariifolium]